MPPNAPGLIVTWHILTDLALSFGLPHPKKNKMKRK
jgi:hypothetical protein